MENMTELMKQIEQTHRHTFEYYVYHKMIHYLHLCEGELEDISEFVANVSNKIETKFFSAQAFQNLMENITEVLKQIEQVHWHAR